MTQITTKNSSTASAVPSTGDLVKGELAVNVADKKLYTKDAGGVIVEVGINPTTIDINAGTIDGTPIGATTPSTGVFTNVTSTALSVADGTHITGANATAADVSGSHTLSVGANLGDKSAIFAGSVTISGGVYLGGTGAANKLDDYEEGTWTPALSTGTHSYSVQHGKYTKIGNQVTVWARMIVTSRGSNGSELGISGLPFSSSGSPLASTFGMLNTYGTAGLLPQAVAPTGGSMEGNIAYLRNQYATNSSYTVNHLNSSGGLTIAFTYMTA